MSCVERVEIFGKEITIEAGKFAKQANGSVMVSCGGTQVLVTVCADDEDSNNAFFPLTVDYIEKFYAAGKIPGGYFKREARPSWAELITARVIDRSLRPNFPEEYQRTTQVICTVLSFEIASDPAALALLGASCALTISDIPFGESLAGIRVAFDEEGKLIVFPTPSQLAKLDLFISAKRQSVVMVEASASFVSEQKMLEAMSFGHQTIQPLLDVQQRLREQVGKDKIELTAKEVDTDLEQTIKEKYFTNIVEALAVRDKIARKKTLKAIKKQVVADYEEEDEQRQAEAVETYERIISEHVRQQVLTEGVRIDGRSATDIRSITCETGLLGSPHGSSLFTRGETQAMATVTLGTGDDEQRFENLSTQQSSSYRFMLHYNFPPYCVGETRRLMGLSRREIGHGYLAERALSHIIPEVSDFGYTIRIVSEVLESNGSSSMASVCAGTMALLHAGVPIKSHIAGVAMGLISDGERTVVLSDILGDEDHLGDMDFKVCGDEHGITALQMDIKVSGLAKETLEQALEQARQGRLLILKELQKTIKEPCDLPLNAPRITSIKISEAKIRDLIGPGGKVIKKVIADTGVKLDIEDNGVVRIISPDFARSEAAKAVILSIVSDPEVGSIHLGTVKKVTDFGAFIEIKPGIDGLCHISQLADRRIDKVTDIVNVGDEVMVRVIEIDRQGRFKLSRKDAQGESTS